jgi:putative DNA primase/helicase
MKDNSPTVGGQFESNGHGPSNGSPFPQVDPDPFEGAYDWLFVAGNPVDARTLMHCNPSGRVAFDVEDWQKRTIKSMVSKRDIIIVAPSHGAGLDDAMKAAADLGEHAARVIVWKVPELGNEETPDLETYDERYGDGKHGGLSRLLGFDRPWLRKPEARGASSNGKHTVTERAKPRARLIRASDIEEKPIEWLWKPRIPLGMLTLFAGDPKLGKSLSTIGIAAAISCGKPLPLDSDERSPASVVLMSAEDDASRVIRPRLRAAGACMDRVHVLDSIVVPGSAGKDGGHEVPPLERLPTIVGEDIAAIEKAAADLGDCRLIIIDPVTAYLGGIDDHRNTELRAVLWPLKAMAERLNAAVVLVTHMSKGGAAQAKHRVIGSIAWVGACRANFLFIWDGSDPSGKRVLMCENGVNLAPEIPTLSYTVEDKGEGPVVAWGTKPVAITADEALAVLARDPEQQAERRECEKWLAKTLEKAPMPATDVEAAGKQEGFSLDALKRAKRRLGVEAKKEGFGKGRWVWKLGEPSTEDGSGAPF